MNIDTLLDSMGEDINRLSREAFEMIMMLVNNGIPPRDAISKALEGFNGAYYAAVSSGLGEILKTSVSSEYVQDMRVSNMTLSKALYHHQSTVTTQAKAIINEQLKTVGTVKQLATKLYEGYNFKDDPLKIKKGLPKYLIKEVDALSVKMADKLRTPALRASYLALLNAKSEGEYKSKLKQAVYERNRYYANRIAQTETFRAYSEGEARLHMEDKELTTIKIKMSASHPVEDICDLHSSVDLYGLGAGVYPKEKAPLPPYHPWCRCKTISKHSIDSTGAKLNPGASKELLEKLPLHVQNRIVGSSAKLERFKRGEPLEALINENVPMDYRLRRVGDIGKADIIPMMKTEFKDFGDALKNTTENKKEVTHIKFKEYNNAINKIIADTKNKIEAAAIFSNKKMIYYIVSEHISKVSIPTALIDGNTVLHNHPSGTSFSNDDIFEGIIGNAKKVIVFHPDTYIYEAIFDKVNIDEFRLKYATIANNIDIYLLDAVSKGMDATVASFERFHYIWSELERIESGFTYKRYRY